MLIILPGDSHAFHWWWPKSGTSISLLEDRDHCLISPTLKPSSLPGSRFSMLTLSLRELTLLFVVSSGPFSFFYRAFLILISHPVYSSHRWHQTASYEMYLCSGENASKWDSGMNSGGKHHAFIHIPHGQLYIGKWLKFCREIVCPLVKICLSWLPTPSNFGGVVTYRIQPPLVPNSETI